jgi:hypothetical protein
MQQGDAKMTVSAIADRDTTHLKNWTGAVKNTSPPIAGFPRGTH